MKRISVIVVMMLSAASVQAECALDDARWAYDEEHKVLRLCVQLQGSEQLRCTTFPQPVVVSPFRMKLNNR